MKMVKLSFPNIPDWYNLVIGKKVTISTLKCKGLQFSIVGLGLTKAERMIFDTKRFEFRKVLNIYFGKLIFSYNKGGVSDHFRACTILEEIPLFTWVYNKLRGVYNCA